MAILLVRHASAGQRSRWRGDDHLRPLDNRGARQAVGLATALGAHRVERILSSPYLRCRQTVEPLAGQLGVEIEERHELAEGAGRPAALGLVTELGRAEAVLCTHGDVIVDLVGHQMKKGAVLVLEPTEDDLDQLERAACRLGCGSFLEQG